MKKLYATSVLITLMLQLTQSALTNKCLESYNVLCFKLDLVKFVEKLNNKEMLAILPGIKIIKDVNNSVDNEVKQNEIVAELARTFPDDKEARLDAYLYNKIEGFLNSHSIQLKLWDQNSLLAAQKFMARGKKDKGMGQALMAGLLMMKATLLPIGMGALAMLAGKALMTGLISLMLSSIIGLKSLASGGQKSATYEIISKPVVSHTHSHSTAHEEAHGGYGYGRSINDEISTLNPLVNEIL